MRRSLAAFSCLIILLLAPNTEAQRRRPRPIKARQKIAAAQIEYDLVGKSVPTVLSTGQQGRWTFAAGEWKEVVIISTSGRGKYLRTIANVRTGAAGEVYEGYLRLYYEKAGAGWTLNDIENISFRTRSAAQYPTQPQYTQQPSEPVALPIARGAYAIAAGAYQYFAFHIDYGIATVAGEFRAAGGSGNDIEVYILNDVQFENFANGHATSTYYNSGRATVGRLNVPLAPGRYVLVFSNKYSVFTSKAVTADISIIR